MSPTNHKAGVRRPLDAYYTPDTLAETLVSLLPIRPTDTALEPHAGGGAFVRALVRRLGKERVWAQDINPAAPGLQELPGGQAEPCDFLEQCLGPAAGPTWIVGNPPYGAAAAHLHRALECTYQHVAFLLRLAFLESTARVPLWTRYPPRKVWVLVQRPSFTGTGTDSCAYGWFWWDLSAVLSSPELSWF
jgi:hypothetical protein